MGIKNGVKQQIAVMMAPTREKINFLKYPFLFLSIFTLCYQEIK